MATRDHYDVLGIERSASEEDIRRVYRRLAKEKHPDVDKMPGATGRFQEINEAYQVLSDPQKRAEYDSKRREARVNASSRGRSSARNGATSGGSQTGTGGSERGSKRTQDFRGRSQEREARSHRGRGGQTWQERDAKERAEREERARREHEDQARREREARERAEREKQAREEWEREILGNQERRYAKQDMIIGANTYTQQNAKRRGSPYIWVSWLSKLLAGSSSCEWASWFKTQYEGSSWEKVDSDFDLEKWKADHTAMCLREENRLCDMGATVKIEDRNSFNLPIGNITLGGKPDFVASFPDGTLVVGDCKTGKSRDEHIEQVMLYMWALPLEIPEYRGKTFSGRVVYRDSAVSVPASEIDDGFVLRAKSRIDLLADDSGAHRAPSRNECRFCDIPRLHCDDRVG